MSQEKQNEAKRRAKRAQMTPQEPQDFHKTLQAPLHELLKPGINDTQRSQFKKGRLPRQGPSGVQEGLGARFWRVLETFWEGFLKGLRNILASFLKGLEASWFLVALWGFDLPSFVFCCFLAVLAAF